MQVNFVTSLQYAVYLGAHVYMFKKTTWLSTHTLYYQVFMNDTNLPTRWTLTYIHVCVECARSVGLQQVDWNSEYAAVFTLMLITSIKGY